MGLRVADTGRPPVHWWIGRAVIERPGFIAWPVGLVLTLAGVDGLGLSAALIVCGYGCGLLYIRRGRRLVRVDQRFAGRPDDQLDGARHGGLRDGCHEPAEAVTA